MFANVSEGQYGRLSNMRIFIAHVVQQGFNKTGPHILGQLNNGDFRDYLSRGLLVNTLLLKNSTKSAL